MNGVLLSQPIPHRDECFAIGHLERYVSETHRATRWIPGPAADLFERDRVVLAPRGKERIPSRPLAQPEAQQSDVKWDGTIEASHLEM
jgi:hypothetical protein